MEERSEELEEEVIPNAVEPRRQETVRGCRNPGEPQERRKVKMTLFRARLLELALEVRMRR